MNIKRNAPKVHHQDNFFALFFRTLHDHYAKPNRYAHDTNIEQRDEMKQLNIKIKRILT